MAAMLNKNLALALGALTGLVSLVAMVRLVSGAFDGGLSMFAWVITLLAMVPWVGVRRRSVLGTAGSTAAQRPGRGGAGSRRTGRGLALRARRRCVALACSLVAFAVIWVRGLAARRPRGEDRFVRIEELTADDRD